MPVYMKNSREYRYLSKISGKLAVEFKSGKTSIGEIIPVIKREYPKFNPKGTVNDLQDNGFIKITGNTVILNNYKGGEKVVKNYTIKCNKFELKKGNQICNTLIDLGISKGTPEKLLKEAKKTHKWINKNTINFMVKRGFLEKQGDILLVKGL